MLENYHEREYEKIPQLGNKMSLQCLKTKKR